jgi:hypothetical protein
MLVGTVSPGRCVLEKAMQVECVPAVLGHVRGGYYYGVLFCVAYRHVW